MVSFWVVGLTSLLLSATNVVATGGFPPVTSPPGACGLFPADASCATVFEACVNTLQNKADPYSSEVCVAAASCYPTNPDSFLSNLFCRIQGPTGNPPKSADIPRVPPSILGNILVRGEFASLQSYTSWYNRVVTSVNPNATVLIDPAFVKMSFDIILAWTGFCSNGEVPAGNLGDWFQFFSTVTGPATTCNLVPNCPITFYPYAMDLTVTCAHQQNAVSNPFSIQSCVAAALNWHDGVDSFLQALTCRYNIINNGNVAVPASNNLPPLSFNLPVSNPPPYTQQNFVDFTYGSVTAIGTSAARYPSTIDFVTRTWASIVQWTNFCSTGAVPQQNLSDLLQYSHVALTGTCSAVTCTPDANASCNQLFTACLSSSTILTDPYADSNCVLAATCWGGGINAFGNAISCAKNTQGKNANPQFWPRLTQAVFNTLGNSNTGIISQQNYIDAFYGSLGKLSSPIWPDVNYVIGKWTTIATWAKFPNGNIPYGNFADWLTYSAVA